MKVLKILLALSISVSLCAQATFGASATTKAVGFMKLSLREASDTILSAPLTRPVAFQGVVDHLQGTESEEIVVGSSQFTAGAFSFDLSTQPETFYLQFLSGAKEGSLYTVVDNTEDTIVVDSSGADLSVLASGDSFKIVPYWNLGSLFPSSDANTSFIPSPAPGFRKTEIIFFDPNSEGINPSAASTYYFFNNAWRKAAASVADSFDHEVVFPDIFVIVRMPAGSGDLSLFNLGTVHGGKQSIVLNSSDSGPRDNVVAHARPVSVSLDQSGLIESGAFTASLAPGFRTDELFTFDSTAGGINKSAFETFYYWNGAWRKAAASAGEDFGGTVLEPGAGFIVRKGATTPAQSFLWTSDPGF